MRADSSLAELIRSIPEYPFLAALLAATVMLAAAFVVRNVGDPATSRQVTVPMQLPESTPQMQLRADRTIFNYGAYQVEARFLPDGGVDVVYNSGFLNPLSLE